jgi:hypothetical protein
MNKLLKIRQLKEGFYNIGLSFDTKWITIKVGQLSMVIGLILKEQA